MNQSCPKCSKVVFPVEKFQCLDQTWHKGCFVCQVCNMQLNMKNYRGFQKKPYCNAHYPQFKPTSVVDTPETIRLANQTKNQSIVSYHADYEKSKGQYTEVAETPEIIQARAQSALGAKYKQAAAVEEETSSYSQPSEPVSYSAPKAAAAAPPPAPVAAAAPSGPTYRAQFAYEATDSDEVSFIEGDIIVDGNIVSEGWMKGTVERTGAYGLLPSNYVEEC